MRAQEARALRTAGEPDVPTGFCECGCGQKTPIAKRSDRRRRHKAGQHIRFISGHNGLLARRPDRPDRTAIHRRYVVKNRDKVRARQATRWAERDGRLVPPQACSTCGTSGPVEAHHVDYSRPLDVIYVCMACHVAIEKHLKERGIK